VDDEAPLWATSDEVTGLAAMIPMTAPTARPSSVKVSRLGGELGHDRAVRGADRLLDPDLALTWLGLTGRFGSWGPVYATGVFRNLTARPPPFPGQPA
jgi:hypothetical protein